MNLAGMAEERIPPADLRAATRPQREELIRAFTEVLDSGHFLLGPRLQRFEADFAAFTGAAEAVGVASGLDAMELTLRALGIGPGDEVVVPSNTYFATWLAVTKVGATPVPVEPRLETYNIDPDLVEAAITPRTRMLLPVHLYGQPADMAPLMEIAARHGLTVMDDCAQAHGARYRGRPVGSLADVSAWSFYPTKNLGALADAGAVTTDRADLADQLRVLRNYGSRERYVNEVLGTNSRMDEIQAALLAVRLRRLEAENEHRQDVARRYREALAGTAVALPEVIPDAEPVWHQFVVRHPRRDALRAHLAAAGVDTLVHYPVPPHLQAAYAHLGWGEGAFPISERIHREVLSLPMGEHVGADEVERVAEAVAAFGG
jgi:dTDP-4-amino-4,6-dideoxygalactose transaminase